MLFTEKKKVDDTQKTPVCSCSILWAFSLSPLSLSLPQDLSFAWFREVKMKKKKEMKMEENETQGWRFIRASLSRIYGVYFVFLLVIASQVMVKEMAPCYTYISLGVMFVFRLEIFVRIYTSFWLFHIYRYIFVSGVVAAPSFPWCVCIFSFLVNTISFQFIFKCYLLLCFHSLIQKAETLNVMF